MEHLFAVRVLVHYYDKPKVDHAAVRRLLSAAAVNDLPLLLSDGTTVSLSVFIATSPANRKLISDIVDPCASSLIQVASIFMLAEARAAADAICISPNELETACLALERLLGCLIPIPPQLPVRDINLSARVKLGTTARRRALHRITSPSASSSSRSSIESLHSSILKAVGAVLRLCDVATHCLAVVSRQCISPLTTCQSAVNLSTRLLTLAASLHEAQLADSSPSPALSFFSSNSLRTALVSGAMHLGAISIEHLSIEPMTWIHIANHIVISSVTSVPQRTSVISALFGGMIKGGRLYESCERDVKSTERALLLLSTLHVVLETDASMNSSNRLEQTSSPTSSHTQQIVSAISRNNGTSSRLATAKFSSNDQSGTISQAARSFLGERVIAAEEDGDEGRIAARTVYHACEEYAQRCGETEGIIGLLCRLFDAAGRQCRLESTEETIVSLSDSTVHFTCPPDESDASSDGPHARLEGPPFHVDIFDQRMKDALSSAPAISSGVDDSIESVERLKSHRQIGALALETLAHWVDRSSVIEQFEDIDMAHFAAKLCTSASLFTLGESSSSYDLRSAMSDFGLLLAPVIDQTFLRLSPDARSDRWKSLASTLIHSCRTLNPIVSSILNSTCNDGVALALLHCFLENEGQQGDTTTSTDELHGLPIENILQLIFKAISKDSALLVVNEILQHLNLKADVDCNGAYLLNFRSACFVVLSCAIYTYLGFDEKVSHLVLQTLTGLYSTDVEHLAQVDPHQNISHLHQVVYQQQNQVSLSRREASDLFNLLKDLPSAMRRVSFRSGVINNLSDDIQIQPVHSSTRAGSDSFSLKRPRAGFNFLWSLVMTHYALTAVENASGLSFPLQLTHFTDDKDILSSISLFIQLHDASNTTKQISDCFAAQIESPITKMFVPELMSILLFQSLQPGECFDVLSLLTWMVKNTTDVLSISISDDWSLNLSKLHSAFRNGFSWSCIPEVPKTDQSYASLNRGKGPLNLIGTELAMGYIQKLSCGKISEVLTHVMQTSTRLLDSLQPDQIEAGKDLIFDVLVVLPFVPESFKNLSPQLFAFVEKFLRIAFPDSRQSSTKLVASIDLTTRVCGLAGVLQRASNSSTGIQAFSNFVSAIANDMDIDLVALEWALDKEKVSDSFGSVSTWLRSSLPRINLNEILTSLLLSDEESAIMVSVYAQSLASLKEACQKSKIWRSAVLNALQDLILPPSSNFLELMVKGPVIQTPALHEEVISLIETVLTHDAPDCTSELQFNLLLKCLLAVKDLFEEKSLPNFENRSRLMNFAVRILLMSTNVDAIKIPEAESQDVFESLLFSLIFSQLRHAVSILQENGTDEAWKQSVLTLSLLLDAFQAGISDEHSSVFDLIDFQDDTNSVKRLSNTGSEPGYRNESPVANKRPISSSPSSVSSSVSESPNVPKLCTYTTTGEQYVEQHWYFCYSCDLAGSDGVCSVCARVCHKGCELAYSKFSRFFCDCGHGAATGNDGSSSQTPPDDRSTSHSNNQISSTQKSRSSQSKVRKPCICLKHPIPEEPKVKVPTTTSKSTSVPRSVQRYERELQVCRELRNQLHSYLKKMRSDGAPEQVKERFSTLAKSFRDKMGNEESIRCLLKVAIYLIKDLDDCDNKPHSYCKWGLVDEFASFIEDLPYDDVRKILTTGKKIRSHKVIKPGSFDLNPSSGDRAPLNVRGSQISYCSFHKTAAVSVSAGAIEVLDMTGTVLNTEAPSEKVIAAAFGKVLPPFVSRDISFHPENQNILLAYDETNVSVYFREMDENTPVWRYAVIEIGLTEFDGYNGRNEVVSCSWVDGEASLLLLTTEYFVKVFDVAVDTFCPCFYARIPDRHSLPLNPDSKETKNQENLTILSASVIRNPSIGLGKRDYAVLLMCSDGSVFVTRTKTDESTSPLFKFCFSVSRMLVKLDSGFSSITQMHYLREQAALCVILNDGSLLLVPLALKFVDSDILFGLRTVCFYKAVFPSGSVVNIEALPGPELKLFFFQKLSPITSAGMLAVNARRELEISLLSGNPSSSVLGLSTFSASPTIGGPVEDGAFILLDDGSIHRVSIPDGSGYVQTFEESPLTDIVERRARRESRSLLMSVSTDDAFGYLPDPIGFFEKSRLISEPINVQGTSSDENEGINFDRMGVVLAGESGDSMVSTRENQSLKFSVSINNKSLVLVGARLRVGGTERSRHKVPAEVKVFGRLARSLPSNGVKRWIDIPFSVPESTNSPQRVLFELVPRRSTAESRQSSDGFVAVDCIELHGVSNEEFTERKLAYESERSHKAEQIRQKREKMKKDLCHDPFAVVSQGTESVQFSPEQASIIAVLQFSKENPSQFVSERGLVLSEVCSLWSIPFEDAPAQNPTFLQYLMKACLEFLSISEETSSQRPVSANISRTTLSLLADGSDRIIGDVITGSSNGGFPPSPRVLEKCLFSLSSVCRSLFSLGCIDNLSSSAWFHKLDKLIPSPESVVTLLRWHINLGRKGRQLYKSTKRAYLSAVDISFFLCIRESQSNSGTQTFVGILVDMLCGHDQYMRLATAQRLLELFDSLDGLTSFTGSPLEINGFSNDNDNSSTSLESAQGTELVDGVDDPGATQSWAYRCDSCGEVCDHEWWHCNDCEDFDLCTDCLRGGNDAPDSSHRDSHTLLRGTIEDESNDQNDSDSPLDPNGVVAAVQSGLRSIVNEVLDQLNRCTVTEKWRFLDAAETLVQLLCSSSPVELRQLRLMSLFSSSYPEILVREIKVLITDLGGPNQGCSNHVSGKRSSPSSAIAVHLLIRILLCSKGITMPLHIRRHGFPNLLVHLLSTLHEKFRSHARNFESVFDRPAEKRWNFNIMDEVVWNDVVPGLSYNLMALNCDSNSLKPFSNFESLSEGANALESVLILLLEVLRILDYSYRSAYSSEIAKEMEGIPRNTLCDIINFCEISVPQTSKSVLMMEVSTEATNFISTLSFDHSETFNDILDKNLYEEQVKRLRKTISEELLNGVVSYKASTDTADILESLHKAAQRQPRTWRTYASQRESVVWDIFQVAKMFEGDIQVRALRLLAVALSTSSELCPRVIRSLPISDLDILDQPTVQSDRGSESTSGHPKIDSSLKDCWTVTELLRAGCDQESNLEKLFSMNDFEMLDYLITKVMLKSQNVMCRRAASHIIVFGLSITSSSEDPSRLLRSITDALLNGLELMQFSGEIGDGLMHCLRFFITCCQQVSFGPSSATLLSSLTTKVMNLLKDRCSVLVSHPNARLYCRLSEMLDLSGYYLESDPCMACATAAWESSGLRELRLDMVRAETKYTDCSIMHRLISPHEIHGVSVKIVDPRRTRRPNRIDIYYSMRSVSDAAELKNSGHPWKKLKSLALGPHRTEASTSLTVPISIANIKLEFVDIQSFYVSPAPNSFTDNQAQTGSTNSSGGRRNASNRNGESLQCPRCSRTVTDRHGICRNCHENAYQCRQCRNINYENLDGFLCNECGYCKHGRFEFSVNGRATYVAEPILNEDDRTRASKIIEKETSNVHRCMEQLARIRSSMIKSLVHGIPVDEPTQRSKLVGNSRIGLADLLDSMSPRPEIAVIEALLEGQVGQEMDETSQMGHGVNVAEEVIAEGSSTDAQEREHSHRSGSNVASPLNRSSRSETAQKSTTETYGLNRTTSAIASTYSKECKAIFSTMSRGIRILSITRAELVRYANHVGGNRLFDVNQTSEDDEEKESFNFDNIIGIEDLVKTLNTSSCCYGCTQSFIANSLQLLESVLRREGPSFRLVRSSTLAKSLILVCSLCERLEVQADIRNVITLLVNDNLPSTQLVSKELERKIGFCIDSFETVDAHSIARFEMAVLESTASLDDSCWEERLKLVIRILFRASKEALTCSSVAESIILPCLRVALRLSRSDSDLTIIDSRSPIDLLADGSASASVSVSREQAETSETDIEDVDSSGAVGHILQETAEGDVSVRLRMLQSNFAGIFGYDVNDHAATGPSLNTGPSPGLRDSVRPEDRRSQPRQGSDAMTSSRAPSSIGTAFDGHVSDEDIEVPQERLDVNVNMNAIQSILEKDHDGKRVNANIGSWLQGKQTHSSWVSEMVERSHEDEEKERSLTSSEGILTSGPSLRSLFHEWKQVGKATKAEVKSENPMSEMLSISHGNWVVRLMLFTPCTAVRKEACALLELICGQEEALQLQLLDLLSGPSLQLSSNVGEKSKEFFDLLESSLISKNHRLYLIGKGFVPHLASLILAKAKRLIQLEIEADASVSVINFMEGYSLKRLVSLMRLALGVVPSKRPALREKLLEHDNNKIVKCLQRAYLYVRKLISLKTRLTDECASQLGEILLSKDFLFVGSTVTAIVSACVMELRTANRRNDAQGGAILLEELCQMLCPERREPTCLLTLNKTPTQEEFIRGSMSRNPYSSTSFDGPLMRDVKNKICRDMDLPGLVEDDFAMELLVAGNVVKLDLPIMAVYEHVWRGSAAAQAASSQPTHLSRSLGLRRGTHGSTRGSSGNTRGDPNRNAVLTIRRMNSDRDDSEETSRADVRSEPPMVVVYRLSGVDGEATEPIIDSLPVARDDEQSAEELYGDTVVLGRVGGFDVLFQLLAVVGSWGDDAETAVRAPALRLLRASCEVSKNRAVLAKSPNAVSTLLDCAASAFEHAQGSPAAVASAESLLIAAEQILAQQRRDMDKQPHAQQNTVSISTQDPKEVTSRVEVFLGRLEKATSPTAEYSILHLLPFLIQGTKSAIDLVLAHLRFSWVDIDYSDGDQRKAKQLGTVLGATPKDLHGNAFIIETIRAGIAEKVVKYIISKFPLPKKDNIQKWDDALEENGVPYALKVLTGLSSFLDFTGDSSVLLKEIILKEVEIIPVLSQLEMAVSDNSVGTCAEELLEGLSRSNEIEEEIVKERTSIKKARREAAQASRAAILEESGLSVFSGDNAIGGTNVKSRTETHSSVDKTAKKSLLEESVFAMMDDLPDEVGPACVVCGDGFRCRPEDALGMYVFCKKVPLDLVGNGDGDNGGNKESGAANPDAGRMDWETWTSGRSRSNLTSGSGSSSSSNSRSGSNWCFSSVTHMNPIHVGCHREAARMDRTSRRDEWDGAALRNSQTRCNNMLPVRPPITVMQGDEIDDKKVYSQAVSSYRSVVEGYFSRLSGVGRTNLSKVKIVIYDIGRSLLRFSNGGTAIFAEHSKGGGAHSNACLLPYLVQLGAFLIENGGDVGTGNTVETSISTQNAALKKYLDEDEVGDMTYYLGTCILVNDLCMWNERFGKFLLRGLRDRIFNHAQLFRLIAFTDLVNRALKKGMNDEKCAGGDSGQSGDVSRLKKLSRHLTYDESFATRFGDLVNGQWETSIRTVESKRDLKNAIEQNIRATDSQMDQLPTILCDPDLKLVEP